METHLSIGKILSKRKVATSIQKPFAENLKDAKKLSVFTRRLKHL